MYIYKISSKIGGNCYIGSTTSPLKQRFTVHKSNYNRHLEGLCSYISSIEVMQNEDADIMLVEELPEDTKKIDLLNKERFYIQKFNAVNKNMPGNLLSNQNYFKEYYQNHKVYTKCGCGSSVSRHNQRQHLNTAKHKNYLKNV